MHKIYYWPKVSKFSFSRDFIYRRYQNNVWSLVIFDYFHKTTSQLWTENSKMTELKDCETCQENVSLSLAKAKLDEKNEWKFSNQLGEVMYASIYLTNCRKSFFFSVTLYYDLMTANIVRLNASILKIYQRRPKLQAFISQFN